VGREGWLVLEILGGWGRWWGEEAAAPAKSREIDNFSP
jgi:hypothetical protein